MTPIRPLQFGEDEYYGSIIKEDERGYDFEKLRDSWREGTDLIVNASFYAISDDGEEDEAPEVVEEEAQGGSLSAVAGNENAIDVEAVDMEAVEAVAESKSSD